MSGRARRCIRLAVGVAVLAFLVRWLGAGPFLDGLRAVSAGSVAVAIALTMVTTVSSAWRWSLVSRGLGVGVPMRPAIAAYYRSQFLNTVLPGGILGDVHRGVDHGHQVGDIGRGLRAVGWERAAGQLVQAAAALLVLLTFPSPVRAAALIALAVGVLGATAALIALRLLAHDGRSVRSRTLRAARTDLRDGVLAAHAWPGILLASLGVVAGHTATFFVALHAVGVTAPTVQLLPLVLLVMMAMAIPANIGGWGPREGAAAWVFAAAGLGAGQGVAAATAYGVLGLAATLPGAALLVYASRTTSPRSEGRRRGERVPAVAQPEVLRG